MATRIRYGARTPEQLRNREVEATSVDTWATSLVAIYETDPALVAAVLPPPLVASVPEHVRVTIARVDIRNMPPFGAGTFAVGATHDGIAGDYALTMPMSTEQSVVGGRETFGEPKKIADVRLDLSGGLAVGSRLTGSFTRLGVTYVEIAGTLVEELPLPADRVRTSFYLKFQPAPDGKGFDDDPGLVHVQRRERTRALFKVDGEVILRESRFDPVVDLPVRRLVGIEIAERSSLQTGAIVRRLPQEDVIPFAHQRYDNLSPVGEE
ncbi:acetoacetate decarboxylase family protein [Pseudofrankia inefficax]|uniref:Acetoacetate decarboxylase n=1 Tax=Pseudofrankia inefficax (strain DSM 45817 / CECT 9037 / DDB 130130 / EuI1c) TaxID=298654 RepID=E3J8U7_PSEI1|nr:acetoacetate decarboxylase family protein [Pseudofrankia inefficax]ADP79680.1 Acetoacetate decarboxylase [Pseudofrankia inefficax]